MPERPASVPPEAEWNESEQEWELGQKDSDLHQGAWKWWRPGGELVCQSVFNEQGQLHGPFTRFHPDGSESRTGTYRHGREHGTFIWTRSRAESPEYFPGSEDVWQVQEVYENGELETSTYQNQEGVQVTAAGVPLEDWVRDDLFEGKQPESYLELDLEDFLDQVLEDSGEVVELPALTWFREVWGFEPPAELSRVMEILRSRGLPDLYEWRPAFPHFDPPDDDLNLVEAIIAADQSNYLGVGLSELLGGCVLIGEAGNGDSYMLGLFDHLEDLEPAQLYFFDHETMDLEDPIARDLSTFTYLDAVAHAFNEGRITQNALILAYNKLRGRVAVTWHYRPIEDKARADEEEGLEEEPGERFEDDDDEVVELADDEITEGEDDEILEVEMDPDDHRDEFTYHPRVQTSRFLFYRSIWINYLLRNNDVITVEDLPRMFNEDMNATFEEENWSTWLDRVAVQPPTALYLLFRCFFFDDQARLNQLLPRCRESPSRLVRDGAALVEELQLGRKTLGSIQDIQLLKQQFLALDLDPQRADERQEEVEAATEAATRRRNDAEDEVKKWVEEGNDPEQLVWANLQRTERVEFVLEYWRTVEEMQHTMRLYDFIMDEEWFHDGLILAHEKHEALDALGKIGDRRLVPALLVMTIQGDLKAAAMITALADGRTEEHLIPLLSREEKYHHLKSEIVRALRALDSWAAAPALIRLLDHYPLTDSLIAISRKELIREVVITLGAVRGEGSEGALMDILSTENEEYEEIWPLAAYSLAQLGHEQAAEIILERAAELSDNDIDPRYPWSLGVLEYSPARELLEGLADRDDLDLTIRVACAGALLMLGTPPDSLAELVGRALVEPAYEKTDTYQRRIWALRTLGLSDLDPAPAVHHLTSDRNQVREAAAEALDARGAQKPDITEYYLPLVDQLENKGLDALHDALLEPSGVYLYNITQRLRTIQDPASVEPLCKFVRGLFGIPAQSTYVYSDPPYSIHWPLVALASFDHADGNSTLIEGLGSANRHVRQVCAEVLPRDERAILPLIGLLDDRQPLVRSRAETNLKQYHQHPVYLRAMKDRLGEEE